MGANQVGLFIGGFPGEEGLWVINNNNGTVSELTGIGGAVNGVGLFDQIGGDGPDFTQFEATQINGLDLFEGQGSDGLESLWVTDGTAAGTQELLPNNANTQFGLLSFATGGQPGFAVLNSNQALFAGLNATGDESLWSTDGTSAGTFQLFAGPPSGLSPRFLVNFGSSVIFAAEAAANPSQITLWITDGTSAGTHEIPGITGFDPGGGLNPQYLSRLGGLVLFEGTNTALNYGLWVSDGTGAGTYELNSIANANPNGIFSSAIGSGGSGLTNFTKYKGKALFQGADAAGNVGLWMSDGTAAGTTEISPTDIPGASMFFDPNNFIVYEGKVYFAAENNSNDADSGGNLWVTDGTAAGTKQIQAPNEQAAGFFSNTSALDRSQPGFAIVNGELLFRGFDNMGRDGVWAFNGSGSPVEISSVDTASPDLNTPNLAGLRSSSDVLAQGGGPPPTTVVDWLMQNGQYVGGNVLTTGLGASGFSVVGTGDFTGNGVKDVLLATQGGGGPNFPPGTVVDWILQNGQFQVGNVITTTAAGWQVVGIGDVNGDGISDVLVQSGGTVVDWIMQNGQYQTGNVITNQAAGWQVVGTGDFTGNGISDVLVQSGGTVVDWIMQNGQYQTGNVITNQAAGWQVVGTGDYNGDGTSDILVQSGGTVVDWIMKNGQYQSGNLITNQAAGWQLFGGQS